MFINDASRVLFPPSADAPSVLYYIIRRNKLLSLYFSDRKISSLPILSKPISLFYFFENSGNRPALNLIDRDFESRFENPCSILDSERGGVFFQPVENLEEHFRLFRGKFDGSFHFFSLIQKIRFRNQPYPETHREERSKKTG